MKPVLKIFNPKFFLDEIKNNEKTKMKIQKSPSSLVLKILDPRVTW
jgi:ATP-dependent Lon protease